MRTWRPGRRAVARLRPVLAALLLLAGVGRALPGRAQTGSITDDIVTLVLKPSGQAAQPARNYVGTDGGAYSYAAALGVSNGDPMSVPQLGTYDLNGAASSALTISAASLEGVLNSGGTTATATRLQYQVYPEGTADAQKPGYTNAPLTPSQSGTGAGSSFRGSASVGVNVLAGLSSGGTYVLDVRFQVDLTRAGTLRTVTDPPGGGYLYANFYVTPPATTPAGGTTTWQSTTGSGGSTDWTLPANWTNGVPTRFANAVIPARTASIVYPVLNSPTTLYEVNNLTLLGSPLASAGLLTLGTATLRVYGNLAQPGGGLAGPTTGTPGTSAPLNNATLVLAGADQFITGNLTVSDVVVAGSGTKSVINQLTVGNILVFQPANATNGVIIQSATQDAGSGTVAPTFDPAGSRYVQLAAPAGISAVAGQAETTTSFVRGVVRAQRTLAAGTPNSFGNVGLDLTANHAAGPVVVTRVVGAALPGPSGRTAVPIRRYYRVAGDSDSNTAGAAGATLDVVFRYLSSTDELNGIPESRLRLFRTTTAANPTYQPLAGTASTGSRTVSRAGVSSLPNLFLTLGDQANPLPIELAAFTATAVGSTAVRLAWATATEKNSASFEVERSADGATFARIGTVAAAGSSSAPHSYALLDANPPAHQSTIYYRLRQVDTDGTFSYSPVRTVGLTGAAEGLSLFPNPAPAGHGQGGAVTLTGALPGATVTVFDALGRPVVSATADAAGTATLKLPAGSYPAGLPTGVYLVRAGSKMVRLTIE